MILGSVSLAAAEDHVELGGHIVVASENSSPESAGYIGGELQLAVWSGPVGLVLYAGRHSWAWDGHVKWYGIAGRVAVYEGKKLACNPRKQCISARVWLEAGVGREQWAIDEPFATSLQHAARNRLQVGIGADLFTGLAKLGGSTFFRVQRAKPMDVMQESSFDDYGVPYGTSLVFGAGFVFGGN